MAISLNVDLRNLRANQIRDFAGGLAVLRLYTAAYGTLLSQNICNAVFAPDAAGAVLTLNAIADANAVGSGDAAIARILQTDETTLVMEGLTVSDSLGVGNLKLDQIGTTISAGQVVTVVSLAMTEGNA